MDGQCGDPVGAEESVLLSDSSDDRHEVEEGILDSSPFDALVCDTPNSHLTNRSKTPEDGSNLEVMDFDDVRSQPGTTSKSTNLHETTAVANFDCQEHSIFNNENTTNANTAMERISPLQADTRNTFSSPSQHEEPLTANAEPEDTAPLDDEDIEKDIDNPDDLDEPLIKYHLRPQNRNLKPVFGRTWIDKDESGNYGERDRIEESRRARLRRNRVKLRGSEYVDPAVDNYDEDEADDEGSPKEKERLIVKLSFRSDANIKACEKLVVNLPTKTSPKIHGSPTGYRLRTRKAAVAANDSRYYSEYKLDKSHIEQQMPNGLTGHPVARGCWECLGLGNEHCTLLYDERTWPCKMCRDDDHDCDLITPPILKRACERCKRRRTACSYSHSFSHGEACQQCMDDGYRCVAGPAKDSTRPRIRYDRDWVNDPIPKPKSSKRKRSPEEDLSAIQADLTPWKRRDSLFEDNNDATIAAHYDDLRSLNRKESGPIDDIQPPPAKGAKLSKQSKGNTTIIQTKLCHPVIFNHEHTAGDEPCHFCAEPSYAVLGLEQREVEVIDWEDGRGLEEISGGHKGKGVENTRICAHCTMKRLPIIMCPTHEMQPIAGRDKDAIDANTALMDLLSGSAKAFSKTWCAICPSMATHKCCAPNDGSGACGLTLCDQCMAMLVGSYKSDLQAMLPDLKDEPTEERMFGLRADYELLREDGVLMRYVLWNSES